MRSLNYYSSFVKSNQMTERNPSLLECNEPLRDVYFKTAISFIGYFVFTMFMLIIFGFWIGMPFSCLSLVCYLVLTDSKSDEDKDKISNNFSDALNLSAIPEQKENQDEFSCINDDSTEYTLLNL